LFIVIDCFKLSEKNETFNEFFLFHDF
jgi:hypothetical protein